MSPTVNAALGNQRFIFLRLPKLNELSHGRKSMVRMHFEGFRKWDTSYFRCFPAISSRKPSSKFKFLARASSASFPPLSRSGDEYSDQLLEAKPKKKTRRIAGVDQQEIEDPTLIADSDSCFCEFNGVQLHHKICDAELSAPDTLENVSSLQSSNYPTTKISFPMILLHGFGASLFSWNRVMKPLAQVSGSKVLAFDRPAFGLTSRVDASKNSSPGKKDTPPLNPYSMMFSVLATLHFINVLDAEKVILVGHSAGSLVAVDTYFEAPERVAALILVAPAIIAPFFKQNDAKESQVVRENRIDGNSMNSNIPMNLFLRLCSILSNFTKYIAKIVHVAKVMGDMINSLYKKALAAILRSTYGVMAIRMIIDKFGIPAIRAAWYDSNQVSDHVLQGYTKPLTVKGWDKALVEYTVAMLTDSTSKQKAPQAKRLSQISCPVLIVTGDTDRLVPSWNSANLSQAIPGSYLEIIKNCGHLPHEEKAEEFVSIVDKFLRRVFGAAEEQCLQTVT